MAYTNIDLSTEYFNTILYTGTGASNARTGVGFQPDWVWIKARSSAQSHWVVDVIRGADKRLQTNTTSADSTQVTGVTSFDTDGFTVGTDNSTNGSGTTFVSWCWDANGAGVSNTAGTISSTVSANTTAGFSIVSYTGTGANATVGHGLGVAPKMIIIKGRDTTYDWIVWFSGFSTTQRIILNDSDAISLGAWNTLPTSSVFGLGTQLNINQSGSALIAYCFADVKGYSKFGSWTGNASTDGPFIYTGFKPAFIMIKNSNAAGTGWSMWDNKRNTFNLVNTYLQANDSGGEGTQAFADFLSNGIKIRDSNSFCNGSGNSIYYMAFAENPFVTSGGIPVTAR
jgi:hypothetical protein